MAEPDRFELELGAALRAYAVEAPTQVDPRAMARQLAGAHPHRQVSVGPWVLRPFRAWPHRTPAGRPPDAAAIAGQPARRPAASRTLVLVAATALLLVALLGLAAAGAFLLHDRLPAVVVPPPSAPAVVVPVSPGPDASAEPAPSPAPVITAGMSAEEVVAASRAAQAGPPPFTLTTTFGPPTTYRTAWYTACGDLESAEDRAQIQWHYYFDGSGFRQECRYSGGQYVGGFEVLTPEGHGSWDFAAWRTISGTFLGRPEGAPLATPLWLNWINVGASDAPNAGVPVTCGAWTLGPVERVAGRPAQVVACSSDRYWVDVASGLLLKRERAGQVLAEALDLAVGMAPDPSLFAILDASFTTSMEPGRRPAVIELPRVDGRTWSSDSLRGRPAAVLIQSNCSGVAQCLPLDDFVAAVTARSGQLASAAISYGGFAGPSIAAAETAGVPVLLDDMSGWPRWDLAMGVVLFDPDGTVKAVVDPRTPASLAAVLDAFLSGQPIPVPPPWDGAFTVGQAAPSLRGLIVRDGRLSMDTFDLASLAGRPAVVMVVPQPQPFADGTSLSGTSITRDVAAFGALWRELGGRAAFVLVAGSSASSEALATWAKELAAAGISDRDVTVVVPGESSWQLWYRLTMRLDPPAVDGGASVVVDREGVVRRIDADGLPTAADLSPVLDGAAP